MNGGNMALRDDDDLFMADLEGDFLDDEPKEQTNNNQDDNIVEDSVEADSSDEWLEPTNSQEPGQLAVDVYQTKDNIVVLAATPGVNKADLDLSIVESTLTIRGSRKEDEKIRTSDYLVKECYWGEFSRSIILPTQVREEEAEAELRDGMLRIVIPKQEQEKVKKISIN
ncbi:MAG: Hsp20/alpha crystallin family protein [Candidatus Saccharimonadales bacterium]